MSGQATLPPEFAALAPFVEEWGRLETQDARYRRRQELPMARLAAYHEAVAPRLEAIFAHLDQFPFAASLPPAEALLLRLVMAMSEVAEAVELFGTPGVPGVPEGHSVSITGLAHG